MPGISATQATQERVKLENRTDLDTVLDPPDQDQDEKVTLETELRQLKHEAENAFCFGQFQEAKTLLEKIRLKETKLYGRRSKEVQDTNFEISGVVKALEGQISDWFYVDGEDEKRTEAFILRNYFSDLDINGRKTKKGAPKKAPESYTPGSQCSKILMANAILKTVGTDQPPGETFYHLLRQAFESRLELHGPDAVETLVAQRMFYVAAVLAINLEARRHLAWNLKKTFGEDHLLCKGIDTKLDIGEELSLQELKRQLFGSQDIKNDMDQQVKLLGTVRRYERSDRTMMDKVLLARELFELQEVAKSYLILNTLYLREEINLSKESVQEAFLLHAEVLISQGRGDKALEILQKLHSQRRLDFGDSDPRTLEVANMLSIGGGFQFDQDRIKDARKFVEATEDQHGLLHTETLGNKFKLAQILLEAFELDEGFSLLTQIYPAQVLRLGHKHADPMATLQALCCPDFCQEFVSFKILKSAHALFESILPTLNKKLGKTNEASLMVQWYLGYLKVVLGLPSAGQGFELMNAALKAYKQISSTQKPYLKDFFAYEFQKLVGEHHHIMSSSYVQHYQRLQAFFSHDARFQVRLQVDSALHMLLRDGMDRYMAAVTHISTNLHKKAVDDLKPHDPISVWILKLLLKLTDRKRFGLPYSSLEETVFYQYAYRDLEKKLGPHHPSTVKAMTYLCSFYGHWLIGFTFPVHVSFCRDAFDRATKVFGEGHEVTIQAMRALGGTLARIGEFEEAEKILGDAINQFRELVGQDHQDFKMFLRDVYLGFLKWFPNGAYNAQVLKNTFAEIQDFDIAHDANIHIK